ncbi:MAG: restriction endonuclease subunit S [Marinagarivorans sp.]
MTQYPAYPNYKSTGCDWFPEIPTHWEIDRAKWSVTSCQNGVWGAEPDGDDDLVCIRVADFDRQSLRISTEKLTMRRIEEKDRNKRLLEMGDLLLEKSGGGEQQLVGAVVEYNQAFPAVSSNFIAKMVVSDDMCSRFLVYQHSHLYSGRVNFRSIKQTTGIQNLDSQAYLDEPITYPPLIEQQTIARFLDFKTGQIDALIAKKQTLLEKLAEKRTALISHAVTKGLDPSAPMKDSGVAWLGEIPVHWQSKKIKYFTLILRGKFSHRPRNDPRFYDGDYPFIQTGDVANANKFITNYSQTLNEEGLKVSRKFPAGTLVMTIAANIGDMAILNFDACFPDSIVGFVPHESVELNYLFYLFTAMRQQLLSTAVLNTQLNLNIERIADQLGACPPITEQIKISKYLDSIVSKITTQQESIACVVEKLQEYRSALITNAVTGKIDLRNWQAPKEPA